MAKQNEKEGKRPGVVIYFDIRPALEMLPLAERGELFTAILAFAEDGVIPDFTGALAMAWAFIRPKLERDNNAYAERCIQRRYAAYCKKAKASGIEPIPMDEWEREIGSDNEMDISLSDVSGPLQTITPNKPKHEPQQNQAKTISGSGIGKGSGENPNDQEDFETKKQKAMNMLQNFK